MHKNIHIVMNILDIILAVPLCFFIWKGYRKGLIYEVATLVGLVVGTYVAVRFSCFVAEKLNMKGEGSVLIAFFITFAAVVALSFFIGRTFVGIIKLVHAGFLNNLLGAIFSMLECVCILSVLLYYIAIIDSHENILTNNTTTESILYNPINETGNKLIGRLKTYVSDYRQAHPQNNTEQPGNSTSINTDDQSSHKTTTQNTHKTSHNKSH